jgi:hypothetical protein
MLIIFDLRDDLITTEQAGAMAVKTALWDLCHEWRVIPMQHLQPLPTDENPINGKEVLGDDLPD